MERRMIQIKQHGDKYNLYETICSECKCQFTFSPSDINVKEIYMCGGMTACHYVECPECGKEITEWEISKIDDVYNDNYYNNELYDLKSRIKLHRLVKLAEEHKDKELKKVTLMILKDKYGEDEESI